MQKSHSNFCCLSFEGENEKETRKNSKIILEKTKNQRLGFGRGGRMPKMEGAAIVSRHSVCISNEQQLRFAPNINSFHRLGPLTMSCTIVRTLVHSSWNATSLCFIPQKSTHCFYFSIVQNQTDRSTPMGN